MYLTYFDDTGGTGPNYADPQQPVQGLCSVSIDEAQWRDVEQDCRQIVTNHYPEEAATFLRSGRFEFHASAIYQGSGIFRSRTRQERLQLLYDIVDVVVERQLPVLGVYAEKQLAPILLQTFGGEFNTLDDFVFVTFCVHLSGCVGLGEDSKRTLLIGDHGSMKPHRADHLQDNLTRLPHEGSEVNILPNILESIHFVDSHRSFGVQLADTVAYLVRRRITHPHERIPATDHLFSGLGLRFAVEGLMVTGGW